MFPLSVCIIAKNEETHIEECLRRLAPYGFEIVLTDTGSSDRTLAVAEKYTDRIFHFDWCDDFSAARNFCMEKASHEHILSLDCDEWIEAIDPNALLRHMERCPNAVGRVLMRSRFTNDGRTAFEQTRVSRLADRRRFFFTGAVHEQLTHRRSPGLANQAYDAPVTILHVGYDLSDDAMQEKCRRNIALLEKELASQEPDPYLYCQLGLSYRRLKENEKACACFDAGLSLDVDPSLDYVRTMVESYGYTLLDLKRDREALGLHSLYDTFAVRADFVFLMGLIYMNNGLFDDAIAEFQKASTMAEFSVEGVNTYLAFYNMGVILECTGRVKEAREAYRKCGNYEPAEKRLQALTEKT